MRLEPELEKRLDSPAKETGRSKSYYAREAIRQYLDREDYLKGIVQPCSGANPPFRGTSWNGVLVSPSKRLPANRWWMEITRTAEKQITRLARPARKAIQCFLNVWRATMIPGDGQKLC
jgi:Ribbon-helix-helix protein, copG family